MWYYDVTPGIMRHYLKWINIHATLGRYITNHAKPSSEFEILLASKTSSLLQEYFDEIVHWHFQNQA